MSWDNGDSHVNTMGIRGIPVKCECGRNTLIKTSKTKENPGRPFFRCPTFRDDHLFKWVEQAVYEELEDALDKVGCCESGSCKSKVEIEDIKTVNDELMKEVCKAKVEIEGIKTVNDELLEEVCKAKVEIECCITVNEELTEEVCKTKVELKRLTLFMQVGFGVLCLIIMLCILMILSKSNVLSVSSY